MNERLAGKTGSGEERKMVGIVAYGAYVPRLRLNRQAVYDANKWFAAGLRGLAKMRVDCDRAIDAAPRRGEVTSLAGVATEVELDGGLVGVVRFRGEQDLFRVGQ